MPQLAHARSNLALRLPVVLAVLLSTAVVGSGPATGATTTPDALTSDQRQAYEVVGYMPSDDFPVPVARGMNESGTIVGSKDFPFEAFAWSPDTGKTDLPPLSRTVHAVASDVNEAGTIVGHSGYFDIEQQVAVRWVDRVPKSLGTLGGEHSHAEAINEAGMIVGWSNVGEDDRHAFAWTKSGGMVDLTPGASFAQAYDVNESGQVVGTIGDQTFIWEDGRLTNIGAPGGEWPYSWGFAINDAGVVSGSVGYMSGTLERLARWTPGRGWEFLSESGGHNHGWGINSDGVIVGDGEPGDEPCCVGVVHVEGSGMLPITVEGWTIRQGTDIDDAGRIAAHGTNLATGEQTILLLAPMEGAPLEFDRFGLRLRGGPDAGTAVATIRVIDQDGAAVPDALVKGTWSLNGETVAERDRARTGADGRAKVRHPFADLESGDVVGFCVTAISHPDHERAEFPPGDDSCREVVVP